jgi:hypothetical protein
MAIFLCGQIAIAITTADKTTLIQQESWIAPLLLKILIIKSDRVKEKL